MRTFSFLLTSFILAASVTSCASDAISVAPTIVFKTGLIENGALTVPKGKNIFVGMMIYDGRGREMPFFRSQVEWKSDDYNVLQLTPLGNTSMITGVSDWFDAPTLDHEPTTKYTVTYHDLTLNVPVHVTVNIAGTWQISVDNKPPTELILDQHGHDILTGVATVIGHLDKNNVTLAQNEATLIGTLSSRTAAAGTYTAPDGAHGAWTAAKRP